MEIEMKKIAIALAATMAMTSVASAHGWEQRRFEQRNYYNRGGDAGAALFGGLIGGMILGGIMANQQRTYIQEPSIYDRQCQMVYIGDVMTNRGLVQQYQRVCN
jgi:hypothetical protein